MNKSVGGKKEQILIKSSGGRFTFDDCTAAGTTRIFALKELRSTNTEIYMDQVRSALFESEKEMRFCMCSMTFNCMNMSYCVLYDVIVLV